MPLALFPWKRCRDWFTWRGSHYPRKISGLSICGLAVLLLTGSEGVAAEAAERRLELATLRRNRSTPTGVAFSPDGRHLVTGSQDGTATVWDLSAGSERFTVPGHQGPVWSVAYATSGSQFLTGAGDGENNGKLWDAESGALLRTFPPPEGTDGLESGPLQGRREGHGQRVEVVGFSPDGKRVLTGSHDGRVIIWDEESAQFQFVLGEHGGPWIHAADFSPDGRTVALGDYAARITVWDAQTGHELLRFSGHSNAIEFLAWFPDSQRIVTASHDSTARIWDTRTGSELQILHGHQWGVTCVAVSPDGLSVATGGADREARIWDVATGQTLLWLNGHSEAIDGIAYSPDGRRVATTGLDGTIRIWDVTPTIASAGASPVTEVRLESEYLPLGLRLNGDPFKRVIRSVRLVGELPAEGHGRGQVWLDTRAADLNAFGDVVRRVGPEPEPTPVEWRYVRSGGAADNPPHQMGDAQASRGFRLYDVVLPSGVLGGQLQLVLGTTNLGPHRLLVLDTVGSAVEGEERKLAQILPLQGNPSIRSALPDKPLKSSIELDGHYTGSDGRIRRIGVRGTLGGAGAIEFDPNHITFDALGAGLMLTSMGFTPYQITLERSVFADPLKQGRTLYRAVSNDPQNKNRVTVVVGRTETGPHRVLLYRGEDVAFVVPVELRGRRRQEIEGAKYAVLPEDEHQAVAELSRTVGYGFQCTIENGRTTDITFTREMDGALPAGILSRFHSVRSVWFYGERFPMAGLADLQKLTELKTLGFSGSEFEVGSLAVLENLSQLESLYMRGSRKLRDDDLKYLAGMTQLKWLSFYTEDDRNGRTPARITDRGLAHLKGLVRLEYLDLFGHDVSDASVPLLLEMKELEELALSGQGFSDAGLQKLIALPKLRRLRLFKAGVSAEAVEALKQQRPELQIELLGLNLSG